MSSAFLELSGKRGNGATYPIYIDVFSIRAVAASDHAGYSNVFTGTDVFRVHGLAKAVRDKIDEHRRAFRKARVLRTGAL